MTIEKQTFFKLTSCSWRPHQRREYARSTHQCQWNVYLRYTRLSAGSFFFLNSHSARGVMDAEVVSDVRFHTIPENMNTISLAYLRYTRLSAGSFFFKLTSCSWRHGCRVGQRRPFPYHPREYEHNQFGVSEVYKIARTQGVDKTFLLLTR